MITIETADNALKSFYLDAVTEALDLKANPLLAQIGKSSVDVVGKDVKKLIKYGMNGGVSAGSETGDLPTSSSTNKLVLTSTLKNLYGTLEISDKAIRAAANNEGAFVNLLNDEMESLVKSASFNFGRMLYGDGSGELGYIKEAFGGNEFLFESVKGIVEGMLVDFVDETDEIVPSGERRKVLSVNRQNKTVIVDGSSLDDKVSEGTRIFLSGSRNYEITGLAAIFDGDKNIYGVDRSNLPILLPYMDSGMQQVNEEDIQKAIDQIEENSGSKINFIVCSNGVKRALVKYYRELGTVLPTIECAGGHKALSFNGIPLVSDRFCPEGTMYLLNTDDFKIHQLCDWKWLEGEDGKILKQVPGKPVYTATLVKYAELMCERPNGQGVFWDIEEN